MQLQLDGQTKYIAHLIGNIVAKELTWLSQSCASFNGERLILKPIGTYSVALKLCGVSLYSSVHWVRHRTWNGAVSLTCVIINQNSLFVNVHVQVDVVHFKWYYGKMIAFSLNLSSKLWLKAKGWIQCIAFSRVCVQQTLELHRERWK